MKLKLVRHLWGVDHTHGLEHYLPRWQAVGYEAVEASMEFSPDRAALVGFLKASGWRWIPQIFSREFTPGGTVHEHLDSMRRQIDECLPFTKSPVADLADVCDWVARREVERFPRLDPA